MRNKSKQYPREKGVLSTPIRKFFQICGSIFKPDPSCDCGQASMVCISHCVLLFGVGGGSTESVVQMKFAADARPSRLPSAGGDRRGASHVPQSSVTGGIKFSIAPRSFGWRITKWIAGAFPFDTMTHCSSWMKICKLRKACAVPCFRE